MSNEWPVLNLKSKLYGLLAGMFLMFSGIGILNPVIAHADASTQNIGKVSFTFDDGLTSADTEAASTLATYGYTGTDYIITGCVGMSQVPNTCAADEDNSYMTWAQIADLANTYHWEIGSHTVDHPLTAAADNPGLTDLELDNEMSVSQEVLNANGYAATDFASPYGDYDNRSLAVIAKYYNSHRAFQDLSYTSTDGTTTATATAGTDTFPYYTPYNSYPYNPLLLTVMDVQGNVSVGSVESAIDQAMANKQWLVLVFHEIKASGASTVEDDYQYNAADLGSIAAYVKSKADPVVSVNDGLPTGTNLLANSSFNDGIADGWTTDYAAGITADQQTTAYAGHGAYDGTTTGALNSIAMNTAGTTTQSHLFSPQVAVTAGDTYTLENFVNVTSATGGVNYYVDSYNSAGTYITTQKAVGPVGEAASTNNVQVGYVNFTYTPAAGTAFARVYADIAPSTTGYLDNMKFLAPDGTTSTTPTKVAGDVNGDGKVDALDLSIILSNWNKTGATAAQGDLNGDGTVNALDLSIVLANWSK